MMNAACEVLVLGAVPSFLYWMRIRQPDYLEERYTAVCLDVTGRLSMERFGNLKNATDDGAWIPDNFWHDSGGLRGMRLREAARKDLIVLLQVHVAKGLVSREDAEVVYRWSRLQRYYYLRALPGAVFGGAFPSAPHLYAWAAFNLHSRITLRTWTLCRTFGAHECVFGDGSIL